MFLSGPYARNVPREQIEVYTSELMSFPAAVVERAIKAARNDPKRNPDHPPSVDVIQRHIKRIGMTPNEQREWHRINGLPEPIADQSTAEPEPQIDAEMRKRVGDKLAAFAKELRERSTETYEADKPTGKNVFVRTNEKLDARRQAGGQG